MDRKRPIEKETFFAEGPGEKNEDECEIARLGMVRSGNRQKGAGVRAGGRADVRGVGAKRECVPGYAGSNCSGPEPADGGRAAGTGGGSEFRSIGAGLYDADARAVATAGGADRTVSGFAGRASFGGFDVSGANRGS